MEDPGRYTFDLDLCRFGMTTSLDGKDLMKKTIKLATTAGSFAKVLENHCDGGHEHRRVQGDWSDGSLSLAVCAGRPQGLLEDDDETGGAYGLCGGQG